MAAQRERIAKMQDALGPRLSAAESAAVRAREICSTVHNEEVQSHSDEQIDLLMDETMPWSTVEDNDITWWLGEDEAMDGEGRDLNLDVPLDVEDGAADYEVDIDRRDGAAQAETAASANAEHILDAFEQAVWSDSGDTGTEDDAISLSDDYDPYKEPEFPADTKRRYSSLRHDNVEKTVDPSQIDLFAPDAPTLPAIRSVVRFVPRAAPAARTLYVRESKARCNALFAERLSKQSTNADDEGTMSLFDEILRRNGRRRHRAENSSESVSDQNSEESGEELELEGSQQKQRHGKKSQKHSRR